MSELRGERVVLRPLAPGDVPRVAEIQAQPAVASRWGEPDESKLAAKAAGIDECTAFAVEVDGEVVGLIQYHEEDDPMYRHAGIDLFLSESVHGQGLGADAVRTMALHLVRDRGHHRLVIDPAADNIPAIRAYEKVGFRPVGVMRRYERLPGGDWHDGLLMDLLADEL
ncbi:MAG: GNAT family N-acetyltransferase [Actinomycetota bacterium]|nr:GNAT family N-acetyltransferase [Actinomycetota bacterium]